MVARWTVVLLVYLALVLDNTLLTVVGGCLPSLPLSNLLHLQCP